MIKEIKKIRDLAISKYALVQKNCLKTKFKGIAAGEIVIGFAIGIGLAIVVLAFLKNSFGTDILPALSNTIKGFFQ